jgi:predicted RNA binding protein YcfA (HicA-like mRNA interferase family)
VKRRALLNYLKANGCEFLREGTRHTIYVNRNAGRSSAVPRHSEITNNMARKICRDLGVPSP